MVGEMLAIAAARVPAGRWGVGVSGGADSVALLRLLHERADLSLHVIHLNHEARGDASEGDADFVRSLARDLQLPCTIARREEIEPGMVDLPANLSARFRSLRFELFARVATAERLQGVALAHHADDQAETILHRLLRGSSPAGLCGMSFARKIRGVMILRPMLGIHRQMLREYLASLNQAWREDASNQSPKYARNRLRKFLATRPAVTAALLELGAALDRYRAAIEKSAPALPMVFPVNLLADLPTPVARESARRWLKQAGAPAGELSPAALDQLRAMATDAATAPKQSFPGKITLRRRGGRIWKEDK
jgi:tRNA(Ile)-lysidine synthase